MSWMSTWSGKRVDIAKPRMQDIDIRDVAHHLSLLCRFNGACSYHYSVAQHSLLVASILPPHLQFWGLLHDGPEAYYGDIIRPFKHKDIMKPVRDMLHAFDTVFYRRFGLLTDEERYLGLPPAVRRADEAVCLAEGLAMMTNGTDGWKLKLAREPAVVVIIQQEPESMERAFVDAYENLHEE